MNCRPYSTPPRRQRWWQRGALALGTAALLGLPAAQAQFVIIGTDAVSTAGSGSDPIDDFFNFARYQTVYTAAELSLAGMPAGAQITGLGFSVIEDNGPAFPTYTIRMAHTTATNAATHNAATLTTVFGPASYDAVTTVAGSHDMITFSSSFTWNGTSNILVDICTGGTSMPYATPYGGVRAATLTSGSRRVRCDGCGSQCGVNTSTTNTTRPQIRFNYTALSCTQPTASATVSAFSCASPNYTVDVNLTSLGDAPNVDIVSSVHGIIANDVSALGVYSTPSTPWGTAQTITVVHNGDNTCDIVVGTFNQTDNDDVCHAASSFPIPDNGCGVSNFLDMTFCVSDPGTALGTDVYVSSVELVLAHSYVSDLDIQLINPNGTPVDLVIGRFGNGDNLGTLAGCTPRFILQDGGTALTNTNTSNVVGTFNPEQPLTTLHDGSDPNGVWTLRICDAFSADVGDVRFVKVNLIPCLAPTATSSSTNDCNTNTYTASVNVTNLGTSASVDITSSVHGTLFTGVGIGSYSSNPTALGTPETITVVASNPACNLTFNFTNSDNDNICLTAGTFPIPDGGCSTLNFLNLPFCVTDPGTALGTDVYVQSVDLIIAHTWNDDMDIQLINPNGTAVNLVNDRFGSGDNLGDPTLCPGGLFTLQAGGTALNNTATNNVVGTFTPEQPLSTLHDASDPNGTWTLRVCDDTGFDAGDVRFVRVNLVPCEAPVAGGQTIVPACGTNEYFIDVNLTSLGSSASIDLTNDFDANVVTANAPGVWQVGPFPSGTTVTVTLEASNALCDVSLAPQTYNCPPPNDDCSGAIAVNCNSITNGNTQFATLDAVGTCTTTLNSAPGVWYTVTGTGGEIKVALCGSAYDTKLGVFTGTCGTLTCLEGNDDDNGTNGLDVCGNNLHSSLSFPSTFGTTYYVLVTGFSTNAGAFSMEVTCAGNNLPPCQDNEVTLNLRTDDFASETSWSIVPFGNTLPVCSGSGYPNNADVTVSCCLIDGCYDLNVFDSFGDGLSLSTPAGLGGYSLVDANGNRIIDNTADGDDFTTISSAASPFCLPLGTDKLLFSSCDREDWTPNEFVVAAENAAVSAQWTVGDQTDDGYQFWFFNPDGGYNRRIFRNHATSGGFGPPSATRACHVKISSMVTAPVPFDVLLNVRVRSRVNGVYSEFGPACRFLMPTTPPACPPTSLVNNPNNPNFSCGVIKSFGGSDKVYANPVTGANKYRWRFERDGEWLQPA